MKICLLGASFDTGSMGVSALAESSIKCILNRWPDAEVFLLGSGYAPGEHYLTILCREIHIKTFPIRFSKNIFLPYHFLLFTLYGLLTKVLPMSWLKDTLVKSNPYFRTLVETDLVVDISGGDSFSDIYGFRRFFLGFLCKWLVIFLGKKLILLPQTFGPFKKPLTKMLARYILNHASVVYSRDKAGVIYVNKLLNHKVISQKARFCPDVAFILDSHKPKKIDMGPVEMVRARDSVLIGLNISGLLFNGGYTRNNMFGLRIDYSKFICIMIEELMQNSKVVIVLIPHEFTPSGSVTCDPDACQKVYKKMFAKYPKRLFLLQDEYNQNEIKYIIGMCDFFIGSRMHSCIAALSKCIPAVGIAYSKKFYDVFDSIGLADCVADARSCDEGQLLEKVESAFEQKEHIKKHLENTIPFIKQAVLNIFEG